MKKIVFSGGGTAGHIVPNIALMSQLSDCELHYIGTVAMEYQLIKEISNVTFHLISAYKLKRTFEISNLLLPFRLMDSICQAKAILKKIKPDLVFSKGGYVALPVVIAAKQLKITVISHESDISVGLSNRIAKHFSCKIATTFEQTAKSIGAKAIYTGSPIRQELYQGNRQDGLAFCGFTGKRPILLVLGGSQGASSINNSVLINYDKLIANYDVILICGKSKKINKSDTPNFKQVEFVNDMKDIYACCSMCLTRSGSNTMCELVALKIPTLTVPLLKASRGEQKLNATYFANKGCAFVADDSDLAGSTLLVKLSKLYESRIFMQEVQSKLKIDGTDKIIKLINDKIHPQATLVKP